MFSFVKCNKNPEVKNGSFQARESLLGQPNSPCVNDAGTLDRNPY